MSDFINNLREWIDNNAAFTAGGYEMIPVKTLNKFIDEQAMQVKSPMQLLSQGNKRCELNHSQLQIDIVKAINSYHCTSLQIGSQLKLFKYIKDTSVAPFKSACEALNKAKVGYPYYTFKVIKEGCCTHHVVAIVDSTDNSAGH